MTVYRNITTHLNYLDDRRTIYSCAHCNTHLIYQDDIISKAFQGQTGRAYLVVWINNIKLGVKEKRMLITGIHTIAEISCIHCHNKLGWKYIHAVESSQKFKEDKFIVEKQKIVKETTSIPSNTYYED
ncbi:yippee zinc-binding/DNA-binding /Mis18, centromere assembly-domain-containing protein [Absidia repens]|uniref:Protein yippee-like n=1 Tax=Absidia repens TaxID=90262 RepID=A0A1X2IS14_9FUNG|nr:yippee zinc-binding/DNA-binding /Mis18, centromere assembly-domain-containing protein [Absidia repens]